ncbi:MAG: DEAD/DEAH box helicase [bacterium]
MIAKLDKKYNIPPALLKILKESGYKSLYPPQEEALRLGVLDGKNLVLAIPTAAGKTLIAEMCMVKNVLEKRGRCLYVVPLRALASEKYEDFKKKYAPLGISVGLATGEYDMPGNRLGRYDILIATSEKVDSLLRLRTHWLSESLSIAVLDEIHYIHDPDRGPTLEIVAARLRQVNPSLQILALSATINNGRELAAWLDAAFVSSDWRPVPLTEGVFYMNKIVYSDRTTRSLVAARGEPLPALVNDTLEDGGQVLVFVNSRRSTQAVARALSPHVGKRTTIEQRSKLKKLSREAATTLSEPTHLCTELANAIGCGVAFHHAGLHHEQRKIVEDAFRQNLIKVICATPTLAAGVNLPARRVIVRDWLRYQSGSGMRPIPVFEYKQFAGRAGRPGYDSLGEAILIAKKDGDFDKLFGDYINAGVEPLRSQLGKAGALASHILASIASGYASTLGELMDFFSLTFFAMRQDVSSLAYSIETVLQFLAEEEMIACEGADERIRYFPTAFGSLISRLYLDPISGIILKRGLLKLGMRTPKPKQILHLVCCCPDMGVLSVGRADERRLQEEAIVRARDFLVPPAMDNEFIPDTRFNQALRTAHMLGEWIEETQEDHICEGYGVGPGDVRRFVDSAEWLLYSLEQLAGLNGLMQTRHLLKDLRRRVIYGIKEELLDLVSLKGIGRVRARSLALRGYGTLAAIGKASLKELSNVPHIGTRIAASIKKASQTY